MLVHFIIFGKLANTIDTKLAMIIPFNSQFLILRVEFSDLRFQIILVDVTGPFTEFINFKNKFGIVTHWLKSFEYPALSIPIPHSDRESYINQKSIKNSHVQLTSHCRKPKKSKFHEIKSATKTLLFSNRFTICPLSFNSA